MLMSACLLDDIITLIYYLRKNMNTYKLSDIYLGMEESFTYTVTEHSVDLFYELTGDCSPIHVDEDFARTKGHSGRVVYGMLSASLFSTLAGVYLPGENCFLHSVESKFAKPVYIGDQLTVKGKVTEINDTFGEITIKGEIINQDGKKVVRGIIKAGVTA